MYILNKNLQLIVYLINKFQCTAENRVGKVEHSATLHVYGAPYVRPMANVAAVAGKRLVLNCPVSGYPIESIWWENKG